MRQMGIKLSLFSKEFHNFYINKFVGDTFNHTALDSGCTKTFCEESWVNSYIDTLSADNKKSCRKSK